MVDRAESSLHGSKKTQMNRWAGISTDILESIFEKLAFADKLNCGAVCMYWYCITKSNLASRLSRLERPPPLLVVENLVPENRRALERESIKGSWFYCPESKKLLKLNNKCEQLKMSTCAGSSNGWLIFTQGSEEGRDQTTLLLYNPHLDIGLRPPSQLTLPFGEHPLRNVILWGNPVSVDLNHDFAIVITTEKSIAFARYGDSNWTSLDSGDYIDVTSSKNNVYALTATCGVQAWDFSHSSPLKTLDIKPSLKEKRIWDEFWWEFSSKDMFPRPFYLVESNGELLIVAKYTLNTYVEDVESVENYLSFCLYKLNREGLKWEEEEEEEEDDNNKRVDGMIFLGKGQCVSSSPTDFSGYGRVIYCADDPTHLGYNYHVFGEKERRLELPAFWLVS